MISFVFSNLWIDDAAADISEESSLASPPANRDFLLLRLFPGDN